MPSTVLAMWYDDPTTTDPSRLAPARQACSAAPASASAQFDRGGGGALTEKIRNAHGAGADEGDGREPHGGARSVAALRAEGLVTRRQGSGAFVACRRQPRALPHRSGRSKLDW